jgi:serine/threonine protein phosphatase PrpC
MLRSCIEECEAWKEYVKLSTKDRMLQCDTLLSKALCQAYLAIDEDLRDIDSMDSSGCTAVSCIISPSHIVCASVGDSRAVLGTRPGGISKKLSCVAMTEDHKPNNPEERKRIEDAGGFVMDDRVNGELAMSRALGDFRYKGNTEVSATEHAVICIPDICVQKRDKKGDEVLVLACDGVWDVISNEESVAYMASVVLPGQSLTSDLDEPVSCQEAAESLLDLSLHEGSTDNISAIVVKFNSHNTVSNGK